MGELCFSFFPLEYYLSMLIALGLDAPITASGLLDFDIFYFSLHESMSYMLHSSGPFQTPVVDDRGGWGVGGMQQ